MMAGQRGTEVVPPAGVVAALRDIAVRTLAPAALWLGIVVAVGWVIMRVLHGAPAEDGINRAIQQDRTAELDTVTRYAAKAADTGPTIGIATAGALVVFWLTRRWWLAVLPVLSVGVQAAVFLLTTLITHRPRPHVPHLDPAPPTSSYPSGHTGATTALYLMFALLAQRIRHDALRRTLTAVFLLMPLLVGASRLYRGMHHLSDVLMGALNGLVCVVLARRYLKNELSPGTRSGDPGLQ